MYLILETLINLSLLNHLSPSLWAKGLTDVGKIHSIPPIKIQIGPSEPLSRNNQYPLCIEAFKDIKPTIENLKVKASLTSSQVPLPSSPQREPPTASLSAHRLSPAISRWPFPLTLTLQTTNLVNTAVNCCIGFKHIQGIYFNQFLQ